MANELPIPWLSESDLRRRAADCLRQQHPSLAIPVPIELMVEKAGIDIVPLPDLQRRFGMVGFTSADLTTITVDQFVSESRENRYRFTLAHEMAHIVLHRSVFVEIAARMHSLDDWRGHVQSLSEDACSSLEWQANQFAALVLVPAEPLKLAYETERQLAARQVAEATHKGLDTHTARDYAWDRLAERIARQFVVSKDVILRRLTFEGISQGSLGSA